MLSFDTRFLWICLVVMSGATGQTSPAAGGGGGAGGGGTTGGGPQIASSTPAPGSSFDFCAIVSEKFAKNISRVFTMDDYILAGGDGTLFYIIKTNTSGPDWKYYFGRNASDFIPESKPFTDITGALYFGQQCKQGGGQDCSFMTAANYKALLVGQDNPVGSTPPKYAYQAYTVAVVADPDFVNQGVHKDPFVAVKDDSQMPWGLPAKSPISGTSKFFPIDTDYSYLGAAYDPTQQVVFVLTYHDILSNGILKSMLKRLPWIGSRLSQTLIHFWKLDGKGEAHYQTANAVRGYTALVSKSGNLFALERGKWYLLDIFEQKDPIPEKGTYETLEFFNCYKNSTFKLDKPILPVKPIPSPLASGHASNASGNSSETVAPLNPDATSPASSESPTAEPKKEEKSSPMLIILIIVIVIVIVIIIVIICCLFCCMKGKGKDDEKDKEAKPGSPKAGSKVGSKVGSTTGGAKAASTTGAAKSSTGGAGAGGGSKAGGVKPTKSLAMKSTSSVASVRSTH